MVLEVIYVVRHGFRGTWHVDHVTGNYFGLSGPTGIPSDPALAGYGTQQAKQLGAHLETIDPPVDIIYSSPFYRCLETLKPFMQAVLPAGKAGGKVRVENGVGEFYGVAHFDHPSPASAGELSEFFPNQLDESYPVICVPSVRGESVATIHNRVAYTMQQIIADLDADPRGPKTLLICTHAAVMICLGRVLTGNMPDDPNEADFNCFTCALSRFERRKPMLASTTERARKWDKAKPTDIPDVDWRNGRGIAGGWSCTLNGDCSFLSGGEERGWRFNGEESFIRDVDEDKKAPGLEEKGRL